MSNKSRAQALRRRIGNAGAIAKIPINNLPPEALADMQRILAETLTFEIDAEIVEQLERVRVDDLRAQGIYAIMLNRGSELTVGGGSDVEDGEVQLRQDVVDWLSSQLPGRCTQERNRVHITLNFLKDVKAATLFTTFWM